MPKLVDYASTSGYTQDCQATARPDFDMRVEVITSRLINANDLLCSIEETIFLPRPVDCCEKNSQMPLTVSQALGMIENTISEHIDRLNIINSNLKSYFGQLKMD